MDSDKFFFDVFGENDGDIFLYLLFIVVQVNFSVLIRGRLCCTVPGSDTAEFDLFFAQL